MEVDFERSKMMKVTSYLNWLRKAKLNPRARRLFMDAFNGYRRCLRKKTLAADDIAPIVLACKSPLRAAWINAMDLLTDLATNQEVARQALHDMYASKSGSIRFQVISSLDQNVPRDVALALARLAITDKGNKTRAKAAEASDRLALREMIPFIRDQFKREKHKNTKQSLKFHLAMLEAGYEIMRSGGSYSLVIRLYNLKTGQFKGWGGSNAPNSRIHDRKWIKAQIRKKLLHVTKWGF